ncbi:MAG: hypothetical protein K9G39_03025 [Chlorobium sp.]|uniref:hypothetical protein n=1 Tax=Chlorobium sp. TaxID=1095 RepID=UPI0025C4116E|nr:hypothetical protein [Chlorobium sp.]MCF8382557.1 hypothetical protein [Chlorobium sp.]
MEKFFELLSGNPLLLAIVFIAAVFMALSFFRKALQLLVVAAAVGLLYAAWLQVSGGDVPELFRQVQETLTLSFGRLGAMLKPLVELLKSWK